MMILLFRWVGTWGSLGGGFGTMFCNYEAPPPLSPAQRIRFSGMWDESVPRTDSPPPLRPPPVSTLQNAER